MLAYSSLYENLLRGCRIIAFHTYSKLCRRDQENQCLILSIRRKSVADFILFNS
jgi:hypothetical protein